MPDTEQEARRPLSEAMDARRVELDLRWRDVAARAGLSVEAINALRAGRSGSPTPRTKTNLERALLWPPGTIDAYLERREPPAVTDSAHAEEQVRAGLAAMGKSQPEIDRFVAGLHAGEHDAGRQQGRRRAELYRRIQTVTSGPYTASTTPSV